MKKTTDTLSFVLLAAFTTAQAEFRDPPHLAPRSWGRAAADASNGDLYVIGGRNDRVLDLWRLRNGSFERVADGPFYGGVTALAHDAARQRLVAVLRSDNGPNALYEFDGAAWHQAGPAAGFDHDLVYDPVRQQTLLWSRASGTSSGQLYHWDGATLQPLGNARPMGKLAFDSARGLAIVARHDMVHEWNGTAWTTISATRPQLSYWQFLGDPTSGRAVAFSSLGTQQAHAWNGQAWVPWSIAGMPTRAWPILAGNPRRQSMQLVGGADSYSHNDAYEFDGASWQQVVPDTADPVFHNPVLAATGPGTALLFDGGDNSGPVQTALWANGSYTLVQPTNAPSSRADFAMASDLATGSVYLFGGQLGGVALGDFWRWNGTDWQALPGGPPARSRHGLCFDSRRNRVVLYGGTAGSDTWEFDGSQWQQRASSFPPHLYEAHLAFDALRRRSVLVTYGLNGREAWEWDGMSWHSTNPANRPTGTYGPLLSAYDPLREQVIAVDPVGGGGNPSSGLGQAHAWDGSDWRAFVPDPRLTRATAMTGVPGTGMIAQAGLDRLTLTLTNSLPASAESFGTQCHNPNWRLSTDRLPWLGTTYTLRYQLAVGLTCLFTTGFSDTVAGTTPLPLDLGTYGFPGCHLYVSPDFVAPRPWENGGATYPITLPLSPALAGLRLYHQGVVFGPHYNSTSQGLAVQIGSLW